MMRLVASGVFLGLVASSAQAFSTHTSEDRSRFEEREYKKAEPPLLAPAYYIERAKRAIRSWNKDVHFNKYEEGEVTRRSYHNAPPADCDIICVTFIVREAVWLPREIRPVFPAILVLMRKDLSKIYINQIYLGAQGWS